VAEGEDAEIIDLAEYRRKKDAINPYRKYIKKPNRGGHPSQSGSITYLHPEQFSISPNSRTGTNYAINVDKMSDEDKETWAFAAIALSRLDDSQVHSLAADHGLVPRQIDIFKDLPKVDYGEIRSKLMQTPEFINRFKNIRHLTKFEDINPPEPPEPPAS
jgi:hypothetical protein